MLETVESPTHQIKYCVVPENIHTPPTDGQWKFLGGGGAKREKFPRGMGVPTRTIFQGYPQTMRNYFDL